MFSIKSILCSQTVYFEVFAHPKWAVLLGYSKMSKIKDLTGQKFGRLTVIKFDHIKKQAVWECQCLCGKKTLVPGYDLISGNTKSCGCARIKHKMKGTRLYRIWRSMINRCNNPEYHGYRNYGGRGIGICEEWHNFVAFRDWAITSGYNDKLSIDRINQNGNYEPLNCKWSTMKEQENNRRNNHLLTFNGKTQSVSLWSEELGINKNTLFSRVCNMGWSAERALTEPIKRRTRTGQ